MSRNSHVLITITLHDFILPYPQENDSIGGADSAPRCADFHKGRTQLSLKEVRQIHVAAWFSACHVLFNGVATNDFLAVVDVSAFCWP